MRPQRLAWALVAVAFAAAIVAMVLAARHDRSLSAMTGDGMIVPLIGFAVLGAFIIRRRGSHPVGWLMIGIGLSFALEALGEHWAKVALVEDPGSLPLGDFA